MLNEQTRLQGTVTKDPKSHQWLKRISMFQSWCQTFSQKMNLKDHVFLDRFYVNESSNLIGQ